jgi:hypothetical protein
MRKLPLDVIQQIKDVKDYEDIEKFFIDTDPMDKTFTRDSVENDIVMGLLLGTREGGILPPNHLLTRMIDQVQFAFFNYRRKIHDLEIELHELKEEK